MRLYLGIPPGANIDWNNFLPFVLQNQLRAWLRATSPEHAATDVWIIGRRHNMGPQDGLVYLVDSRQESVISRLAAPESADFDIGQTSMLSGEDGGMISEVYLNGLTKYGLAATVYHELLHNKFQNYFFNVHGLADGNFTSATSPYFDGGPSDADQALMSRALRQHSPQCQRGFDLPDNP
jgi:hypothetical protein